MPRPEAHDDCGAPLGIGAAARHLGVSVETLRYYESESLVSPARRPSGHRLFSQRDLDALHVVITMRDAGFTMADVRRLIAVKTDAPRPVLIARARATLQEFAADVARRERALRASRALLRRWLDDLDTASDTFADPAHPESDSRTVGIQKETAT